MEIGIGVDGDWARWSCVVEVVHGTWGGGGWKVGRQIGEGLVLLTTG